MSDSDDPGPLSQRAKRRRISSRSALVSDLETIVIDTEDDVQPTAKPIHNSKKELDTMIAGLKRNLVSKRREAEHQASAAEMQIDKLRSVLSKQEHEIRQLEEALARKRAELGLTKTELVSLGREHESSKAAKCAKVTMLTQAAKEIVELEKLAKELPALLKKTAFGSKDASIMNMLRSFHKDILQKYFDVDGAEFSETTGINHAKSQELDEATKLKMGSLFRCLRSKSMYKIFAYPVTEDVAPDYFEVIKHPMDLSTITRKLDSNMYTSLLDFVADGKLMLDNCRTYNWRSNSYFKAADQFEGHMRLLMTRRGWKW